jgi:hypothetical protein
LFLEERKITVPCCCVKAYGLLALNASRSAKKKVPPKFVRS